MSGIQGRISALGSFLEEMVSLKLSDYPRFQKHMKSYLRMDLLILDEFLLHTITDERELKVLHTLLEKRSELSKSVIVCSQRDPKNWTSMILNDEVAANELYKRATKYYTVVINSNTGD